MITTLRPIASLLSGVSLLLLGSGLLNTIVPLRGVALGFSALLLGALTSAYFSGFLLGTFVAPGIIRRIGHIRAFALCAAVCACAVLMHSLSDEPWLWMLLRLLMGMGLVGLYTAIESWLNTKTASEQRGRVFATYMVVNLGSLAAAQQLLRFTRAHDFVPFVLVALLVCASTLPVLWTRQSQPLVQNAPRLGLRKLFAAAPSAGVGALLSGLAMGAFWGLLPVYAARSGLTGEAVGSCMSLAIIGGAALQLPIGRASDRHDRRLALAVVGIAASVLALLLPLSLFGGMTSNLLVFLYGGAAFAIYPIVIAHLLDHLPPEDLLSASSSVLLLNGIGSALGPLIGGIAMGVIAPWALFIWFAVAHAALGFFAAYRYRIFQYDQSDPSRFLPMLRTTPAALDLHPGLEPEIVKSG